MGVDYGKPAELIHLDTHVAIWIYDRRKPFGGGRATGCCSMRWSGSRHVGMVFEYEVLLEKGRFQQTTDAVVADLHEDTGLMGGGGSFEMIVPARGRGALRGPAIRSTA